MKRRLEQGLLKHLAAAAIALSAGCYDPAEDLARIPSKVLDEVVDDIEDAEWERGDRLRLLTLLSHDRRVAVRARVAQHAAGLWSDSQGEIESLLQRLAADEAHTVRDAAANSFEQVLSQAPPVDRIRLVAEWATSEVRGQRRALARALRASTPVFIGDLAIEQLIRDASPAVRAYAAQALASHFEEDPRGYRQLAIELAADPVRRIRRGARRVLDRASDEA